LEKKALNRTFPTTAWGSREHHHFVFEKSANTVFLIREKRRSQPNYSSAVVEEEGNLTIFP